MSAAKAFFGVAIAAAALQLAACERPPVQHTQIGYRGLQMGQLVNPRIEARERAASVLPESQPPAERVEGAPLARDVYRNVKVLGDLQVTEFNRLMLAMTQWVSPQQGCNYCHNPDDLADDNIYTKVVSRRMLEMTNHINTNWKTHVADTGVTCFTCHRGENVPAAKWFAAAPRASQGFAAARNAQNIASPQVGLTSLPEDPFSLLLRDQDAIRVIPTSALPQGTNPANIKQTEVTYALMMHMSQALGVNCTFCHNSRSFARWESSTPQRVTSWHGIQLARDLNANYLLGLTEVFPPNRLGPSGDVAKINCETCHRGVSKPLYGRSLAQEYPELMRISTVQSAPAPASDSAPVDDAEAEASDVGGTTPTGAGAGT